MSKINKSLSVQSYKKKKTKLTFDLRWSSFFIFQLFVALLIAQPNAWGGLLSLSVDANGDNVFNGKDDGEKLTISFTTSDFGDDPVDGVGGQQYTYKITVSHNGQRTITIGPDTGTGDTLSKNQTVQYVWDGTYFKTGDAGDREKLPDGDYIITVKLTSTGTVLPAEQVDELTIDVTLDTKPPEISITVADDAFSPYLYSLPVYYDIDEDVSEAWLEFQKAPGNANIGRRVALSTSSGSHTYDWDGDDARRRTFLDGQYTLRLRVVDKGGNEAESGKTGNITIDTEEPLITGITINDSIPLSNGKFVNTSIESISFTANDPEGTGIDLTGRDTEVLIRPVGGRNLTGTMTYTDKAVFTLGNTLDEHAENGEYEVTAFISDKVGNLASSRIRFTFDNAVPILKSVATNRGEFTPGSGLSEWTNYVEATLEDNIELNLADSTISLIDPSGSTVLGQQTRPAEDKIRWQLLSPLLAKNGLQDGRYTVEIVGADKAGNRTTPIQITFLFDNLAPEIISLNPTRDGEPFDFIGDTAYYNLPLHQFVVTFNDGEFGTGAIFSGADDVSRIVFGTPKEDGGIDVMQGRAFHDIENSVLTYILNAPLLKTDGSEDGTYRLNVKSADSLGNNKTESYQIIYDTQLPTLESTTPAANQTVSNLSQVVVKLNEVTSGIDFRNSTFRLVRSAGENSVEMPVNVSSNGTDTATLTLLQAIALDGSDDGTYTIEVTPSDLAGNTGAVVRRQFYLVSQTQPKIQLTDPQTGTVSNLDNITVAIENYIGSGINFDASTINVTDAQGLTVPQSKVESDAATNQLTWSTEAAIPRNGTADGQYSVAVVFVDYSGKFFTQSFPLTLDTQFPAISQVEVVSDPKHILSVDSATNLTDTFSQINITFEDSDVDFENSTVSLTGPDGNEIALHRSNDGAANLTLNFQNLANLGTYILTVTPSDNIGNVSETAFIYRFQLDIAVPVVTIVSIGGQIGALVHVDGSDGEIIATLADPTGIGLAVGDEESRIVVTTETGLPVPGITTFNDNNQLIWRPTALPTDGSADGRYTVAVTPVDNAGRTGDVAFRVFIFDTQEPRITTAAPVTLHQPISYIGSSLAQFQLTVEDVGPALLELDDQTVQLQNANGDGVAGQVTHDGTNQLFFTLETPLPTDGSADGEYMLVVNLIDKAGNQDQTEHNIFFDSQAPKLSAVSLNTETPTELIPYQVTDLSETISRITLNFDETTRVDFVNTVVHLIGPDASNVPITLENNGVDEITASFVSLTQGGLYTLTVTPQDIAGNVAQGAVPYPFRLEFEVPGLSSVIANTTEASIELTPYEIVEITESINSLELEFAEEMRIDFANTSVTLTGPNQQEISITQEDDDISQLVIRFVSLTQSGLYTLSVTPQDIVGNVAQSASRYHFRLDIALPVVSSVLIDDKPGSTVYVNSSTPSIVATLVDSTGLGLSLGDEGSTIAVTDAQGNLVPGTTESNGINQLTWTPIGLPMDGSADGRYSVAVTPIDKSGRTGRVVNRQFVYDTQVPRITSSSPVTLHQPKSYIGGSLTQFQFNVEDVGPALLELDDQTIQLQKEDGEVVIGQVTHNGISQLFFTLETPLPTDGSADGEYVLVVNLMDRAGNQYQAEHNIYYDSQVPKLSVVSLNTETPTELTPYQVTDLSETISEFTLSFDETTRVDFDNTVITLRGPGDSNIPLALENNGIDELTASFITLTQGGLYTLSVTPQDIAGNAAQGAVSYPFRLEFDVPEIASVKANTADDSINLTAYETTEISESISSLTLEFTDPTRIDFKNTDVVLTDPNGQQIVVTLADEDDTQLMVRFVTLTQGGLYTLSVTPQDIAGNTAQGAVPYPFRLVVEVPGLASVKANTADDSINLTPYETTEISESISSITLEFTDPTRIDFKNTSVVLTDPNGQQIAVTLVDGDDTQLMVRFVTLTQGGLYTLSVTPQDIAGNTAQGSVSYPFRLELEVPGLASVKANTADDSINLTPYETTEISESISSITLEFTDPTRIDFKNTSVVLTDPNGQQIAVTLVDGDDTQLMVRFVTLTQGGLYTLSVTPQDIAGNTAQGSVSYPFRLELEVPGLASVKANTADDSINLTPYETTEISESISSITLEFTDPTRIDFKNTSVVLTDPNGQQIAVTLVDGDDTQLMVRFVTLTQGGLYTLSVTPQDIAGNTAQGSVSYPFRLELEVPGLASVKANTADDSINLTPYETTEISESISSITLEFTDPTRIDFKNTSVVLTDPNGQQIAVTLVDGDDTQLMVRFVTLTQGGLYTLSVTPQDITGNTAQGAVPYPFRFEFEVPGLASVEANTADDSINLTPYEITEIAESINSLTLEFTDPAQIDFNNTRVMLTDPNGQEVSITLEDGDESQLIVRFVSLMHSGVYTLAVTPQDMAGNIAQNATQYQFKLDIALLTVSSVLIDGKQGATVYVNNAIPRIVATITDEIGVGVSSGDNGSNIVVTDAQGLQVSGATTFNGTNQFTWTPIPLAKDGSADGQYNVTITPVDKVGRSGAAVNRQFIYDSQAPRITDATPLTLHAPVSYIGTGLEQFVLTIEDEGPAGIVFGSQVVALMDQSNRPVPAALTFDELSNQLYLTLSKPFASDGSADGPYTLNVLLVDKAGNRLNSRFSLVYDSQVPEITSVEVNTAGTPMKLVTNEVAELTESITTITIQFTETTRVDFASTQVSLVDPDDFTIPLTQKDDGVSQLTLSFVELTQIGQYILSVTPQDISGNVSQNPTQFTFDLEFILPDVESVIIGDTVTLGSGDIAYVNADNLRIAVNLIDRSGTGLSFDSLTGTDILVATLDDTIIPGSIATNGTDLILWEPITLSTDGSSDGRYAVYVYPVDKKGRAGNTVYREFVYDTQEPEITDAAPINLSQPVSYISDGLTQLRFTVQDVGPADLTLEDQQISLRHQNGTLIPTQLTNDSENTFFLTLDEPLPLDGSRDGEYTVVIEFTDKAKNVLSVEHPIVYDTQAPTLVSTVPADGAQLTEDLTQIQVNLNDNGNSGINWDLTTVKLVDPNGTEISGELTSNGKTQLTLNTNQLVADGHYVIQVQAIDRAGNGSNSVFESSFLLSRRLPAVISTSPITAPQDEAYTNEEVEEIEIQLETEDERHLSTVRLLNAAGQVVAGQQHRETDKLIYQLVRPLATDGSEDGIYTIEFTPISSSGRSGGIQQLMFVYDTETPEVVPESINLIVTEPEVNNSLTEIRVEITDNEAGIDWENLDEDWFTFERVSPNASKITGHLSYQVGEQETIIYRLTVPLADDGSADGKYRITVTPKDKAGNGDETYEEEFTYDTSPPVIDPNSLLINDVPLLTDIQADDYPSAVSTTGGVVIQASMADAGLGVNLSVSSIVVSNPNGQQISGTTHQNGVDTIVFKSDGLNVQGIYQVVITGVGNDSEFLGIVPKDSITSEFLYETTAPTAVVTNDGGKTEFTDEPVPFEGTASDPQGSRPRPQGEGDIPIPASGVWLVEIVGTGPDGQPIEPVPAEDESNAQERPWSRWSLDFLPPRSGEYDLDLRVTDNAGNYAEYDVGKVTMSVSFSFSGNTYNYPNPARHSKSDTVFFSFNLNAAAEETVDVTLHIYDWGGDLVYSNTHTNITPGQRHGSLIKWNLKNQAGTAVARGLYVFRLEAVNEAGNRANAVGKILVVD